MTITLNAGSKHQSLLINAAASGSVAIDAGNGANRLLVVITFQRGGAVRTFSSVTYGGVALTQVASVALEQSLATKLQASIWFLIAPATGSNDLAITMSGNTAIAVHACVFEGVAQATPKDKEAAATSAGSTTPGASVTAPTTDGQVVIAGQVHEGINASAVNTGTALQDVDQGAWNHSSAYVIQTTAGAQTIDWTNAESLNWAAAIASFKAAASGTANSQAVTGEVSPAGAVGKSVQTARAGALTPAGALARLAATARQGAVSFTGALAKATQASRSGLVSPGGVLARLTGKSASGAISPAGALAAIRLAILSIGGALTLSGSISRHAGKGLSGLLAPGGGLARAITKTFAGVLAFAGSAAGTLFGPPATGPGRRTAHAMTARRTEATRARETGAADLRGTHDVSERDTHGN